MRGVLRNSIRVNGSVIKYSIPVLFLLLLIPVSAFAQTDEQVLPEVGVFYDYSNILNTDGSYIFESHEPYIQDSNGDFVPYTISENDSTITVRYVGGYAVFDKTVGAVTIFDDNGVVIDSDSYVIRSAQLNTDIWNNLDVNDSPVTTSVTENPKTDDKRANVTVTFTKQNNEGVFNVEYHVTNVAIKTTAYFTNNIYDNNKFAFTQTVDLPSSIISINGQQDIDLTNYVGQSFPRTVLEQNEDLVMKIKNIHYNSGLGFENLWSVNISTPTKVSLDYANVAETQTNIGETIELDPMYASSSFSCTAYNNSATGSACSDGWAKNPTFSAINISAVPSNGSIYQITLYVNLYHAMWNTGVLQLDGYNMPWSSTSDSASYKYSQSVLRDYGNNSYFHPFPTGMQSAIEAKLGTSSTIQPEIDLSYDSGNGTHIYMSSQGYKYIRIYYTVPAIPDTPSAPTATTNNSTGTISWSAPADNGATIDYYHVYRNGSYWKQVTGTSTTDTGMGFGSGKYYSVKAHNSVGFSALSVNSNTITNYSSPNTPSTPSVSTSNGTNSVSWGAP